MMVANSFDLWQKDIFFSAAEEVQESADTMESAYRLWIKEKKQSQVSIDSDSLCKDLQAALSTAKWQLEEFERAVRLSNHGGRQQHCRDDTTLTRHKQFVSAIENQIHRVESALREGLTENGKRKQPLLLVDLNKEERDDLAMFLSGSSSSQTSGSLSSESSNNSRDSAMRVENVRGECVIDIEERGSPEADRKAGTRRTWSSPNVPDVSALKIDVSVDAREEERKRFISGTEATPKEKGSKQSLFWLQRCRDYNHVLDRVGCYQRRFRFPLSRPIQLVLALTLILFLLLSFRVYSS